MSENFGPIVYKVRLTVLSAVGFVQGPRSSTNEPTPYLDIENQIPQGKTVINAGNPDIG